MHNLKCSTSHLKNITLTIISTFWLSPFVCGQQIGPGVGADTRDARQVIRVAVQAVRKTRNITYKAIYQGTGAFSTHTQNVMGEVAIERISPESPLKAKFAAQGQFFQTGSDERQDFHTTFDGVTINRLRPKERALVRKKLQSDNPTERKLGFVTSFFGGGPYQLIMLEWVEDEPLNLQIQAAIVDYEGRAMVENVLCHVVYVEYARQTRQFRERWFFGINDNLPRKVEQLATDDKGRHGAYVLTLSDLRVNSVLEDSKFRISLPEGYTVKLYEPPTRPPLLPTDSLAPDWKLSDSANREHSLSEYRGKIIVMDFWATWCGPCIRAMPALQKLYDKYKTRGVKVFGINVWEESNSVAYMEQRKFNYGLLLNGEDVAKAYQVDSLPTLYIIGIDGKVIYRAAITNEEKVETVLEEYLKKLETKSKP
jgi:thiol-disulfide isomerase/thioredoxin